MIFPELMSGTIHPGPSIVTVVELITEVITNGPVFSGLSAFSIPIPNPTNKGVIPTKPESCTTEPTWLSKERDTPEDRK